MYSFTFNGFFENKTKSEQSRRTVVIAIFFIDSCFVDIHVIRLYNKNTKINELLALFIHNKKKYAPK